ncbi:12476_t:CDS:2 [Ambispora leptoticha]|uniref:12476_t:CDS:1 n=1 Tax=Ambispora leptoticha TaxID=144679 RepID=A0A9N8YRG4_9GLOM|nr:12476_t:CDS:2 [Ambispora leptoticha]
METTATRRSSKGGGVANSFPVSENRAYLLKDVVESKEAQKNFVSGNGKLKIDENEKNHISTVPTDKRKDQSSETTTALKETISSTSKSTVEYATARPAKVDEITTEEEIESCVGYKANIYDTSLVVCTLKGCNKYFTKIDKFTIHRKREHDTSDISSDIWIFGNMKKGDSSNPNNNNNSSSKPESGIITKDSSLSIKSNTPKKSNSSNISEKNNTGEPPRYYNAMQMHPMGFGLPPYGEIAPPRYDGGYSEMAYSGFYGGNRRFMSNPPPPQPPQRRSR